jgi:hypothetical protein
MNWFDDREADRELARRREEQEEEYRYYKQQEEERQQAEFARHMCLSSHHRIQTRLGTGGPAIIECFCGEDPVQVLFG